MEMDCAVEESEIRRALEGMAGIAQLQFALPQRALRIDADDAAVQQNAAYFAALQHPADLPSIGEDKEQNR